MYRLWLSGLYGLYGPRCPLSSKRPINLISLSLSVLAYIFPWWRKLYCNTQKHKLSLSENLLKGILILAETHAVSIYMSWHDDKCCCETNAIWGLVVKGISMCVSMSFIGKYCDISAHIIVNKNTVPNQSSVNMYKVCRKNYAVHAVLIFFLWFWYWLILPVFFWKSWQWWIWVLNASTTNYDICKTKQITTLKWKFCHFD